MKSGFQIVKLTAALLAAMIVLLFFASLLLQEKITQIALSSLNESISTRLEAGKLRLSFIRNFPDASVEISNLTVFSSAGLDKTDFPGTNTDTLLTADKAIVEFRITDIIRKNYTIGRIAIKNGSLNLFSDSAGRVNYDIRIAGSSEGNSKSPIDLSRINLNSLYANYSNASASLGIGCLVVDGKLRSRISEEGVDLKADAEIQIGEFRLDSYRLPDVISAAIELEMRSTDSLLSFSKGVMKLDNVKLGLTGSIAHGDDLDLRLTGENLDISGIKKYFPEKLLEKIADYSPTGNLDLNAVISGTLSKKMTPAIIGDFHLNGGSVKYGRSSLTIGDLSFNGKFAGRSLTTGETGYLIISDLKGTLGSSTYSGSGSLFDFASLKGKLDLKGTVYPSEIKEFFSLTAVSSAGGSADMILSLQGTMPARGNFTLQNILNLNPDISLDFNSLGIGFRNDEVLFSNISGAANFSAVTTAEKLRITYRDHTFLLDGRITNLPQWLAGKQVTLTASADINCKSLEPEILFASAQKKVSGDTMQTAAEFPGNFVCDLNINADEFRYKTFLAEKVVGTLSYKPKLINFKTLSLNSLGGHISCNGFIVQNNNKSLLGRGTFDLHELNIRDGFTSFQNFGQDFIKSENLDGTLTGSLSILIPLDSMLRTDIRNVNAEGKYIITNGALLNFEPIKALSSFIEISELENIRFEQLENDFFIRSNFLYIPQMDVISSAANISVSGKHGFDNDFEYHIKVLLSEILSKKLKKPKPNTAEFGVVRDDGLGRASLLLKIEDKGSDVKVSYDIKAAGGEIKKDIKAERNTLKNILNEEYGWFKNDTSTTQKTSSKAPPRFRITWDEADTAKIEPEVPVVKKESQLKNIFKKR